MYGSRYWRRHLSLPSQHAVAADRSSRREARSSLCARPCCRPTSRACRPRHQNTPPCHRTDADQPDCDLQDGGGVRAGLQEGHCRDVGLQPSFHPASLPPLSPPVAGHPRDPDALRTAQNRLPAATASAFMVCWVARLPACTRRRPQWRRWDEVFQGCLLPIPSASLVREHNILQNYDLSLLAASPAVRRFPENMLLNAGLTGRRHETDLIAGSSIVRLCVPEGPSVTSGQERRQRPARSVSSHFRLSAGHKLP